MIYNIFYILSTIIKLRTKITKYFCSISNWSNKKQKTNKNADVNPKMKKKMKMSKIFFFEHSSEFENCERNYRLANRFLVLI